MGHSKNSQCLVTYMHFLQRIDGESSNEPNILGFFFFLGGLGQVLVHTYVRPHHNLGPDPYDFLLPMI